MVDLAQKETQHPGRRMRNLRSGGRHMRSGRRHHSGRRHQTGAAADRPNLAELPAAAAIVSPITSA